MKTLIVVGFLVLALADITCDLSALNEGDSAFFSILKTAEVVIHLATSPDPEASELIHFNSVVSTAKLVSACAAANVPKLILASSDWAEPKAAHLRLILMDILSE